MSLSLYDVTVPVYIHGLENMARILEKALAWAEEKKIDPAVLVNARLAPDMYPLSGQIQVASDAAKGGAARGAGVPPPSFPDTETTFPELQERIAKTLEFLRSVDRAQFDGAEDKEVMIKMRGTEVRFTRLSYVLSMSLPNFYFHLTTAYDILRHNGMPLGKMDFIGKVGSL
ncbi:MAG: DUF1993 domain-containing protein [Candidatus Protistobacter heckmanni]|nr:DUF1993 domain-containing protein [Candidatus Protistobacter heckmanni]